MSHFGEWNKQEKNDYRAKPPKQNPTHNPIPRITPESFQGLFLLNEEEIVEVYIINDQEYYRTAELYTIKKLNENRSLIPLHNLEEPIAKLFYQLRKTKNENRN